MKTLFRSFLQVCLLPALLLNGSLVFASHDFGGVDMCILYPEVMPPGLKPELLPDDGGQGATLMQNYCTQCHELPGPGRHTAEEWPLVIDRMLAIMNAANRFSGLLSNVRIPASGEPDQLRSYLILHALKPLRQKPQGTGASAFKTHCSACHVLPDPAQYDIDWPSLIKRMQRNMQVMKYPLPSADSMMQIQLYLQNNKSVDSNNNSSDDFPADHLALNKTGNSVSLKNSKFSPAKLNMGSWLSLGVFFLLTFIGFLRWWKSHRRVVRIKQSKD
ncbi:MAG: hypothetical protein GQ573_01000 [Gammaproteobacteria bacterium]|nr:hypothetical protein [Gammaproteobacteria bacterium]